MFVSAQDISSLKTPLASVNSINFIILDGVQTSYYVTLKEEKRSILSASSVRLHVSTVRWTGGTNGCDCTEVIL